MCPIQLAKPVHERIETNSAGIVRKVPVETRIMIPLAIRRELGAHEEQRFARTGHRIADERAQIREPLPLITGHLFEQRLLEVHHFIVRQRIHESFAVLVHHREGQLVVRTLAKERIDFEIVERVMHPPHVPLEGEAKAALGDGMRHLGPCGALFGDRDHTGMQRAHGLVECFQEGHGFEIFASAQPIAQPLSGLASVVEIQHRRDSIHTQSIDVELFDPVQRVRQQEVAHFITRVIEDVRSPLGVIAKPRIFMLVAGGPIEATQRPVVFRKVRGNPVEHDPNSRLVQRVHKRAKVVGRAVP